MKRVWFHGSCADGFGAAWAASKSLGRGDDVVYVAVSYKSKVPEYAPGDEIYILDFSFPRETLLQIEEKLGSAGKLLVLDHHKTAQEDLKGLDFCIFDMHRSGAGMAWDYFFTDLRPVFINLIEDRDLWNFRFPATKVFQCFLMGQPFDFEVWDKIAETMETNPDSLLVQGQAILDFKETEVERMCTKAWVTEIDGAVAAVVNATGYWSDIGHALLEKYPEAVLSASFGVMPTGAILWSLRGRKNEPDGSLGHDVSAIAKKFGGGGHRSAAGMRTKTLEEVFANWKG